MCGDEKHFSAIPYFTYDPPRKLQWHWTYLVLSVVPAQPVQKSAFGDHIGSLHVAIPRNSVANSSKCRQYGNAPGVVKGPGSEKFQIQYDKSIILNTNVNSSCLARLVRISEHKIASYLKMKKNNITVY